MEKKYSGIREIVVVKANVHNLQDVSVTIPKNSLTVITGPSGSGKSSLAFDTIYVEGQRRYIESLSSYARQFLGQHRPPDVESITGLSPSIAIDQKSGGRNPRSTVGTITEIYDYMRILFARTGTMYCPSSKEEIKRYGPHQVTKEILKSPEKTKIHIMAPVFFKKQSELDFEFKKLLSMGFGRIRINNEIYSFNTDLKFPKKISSVEIIIDRVVVKKDIEKRIAESVEYAMKLGQGSIVVLFENEVRHFSSLNMSPVTKEIYPDLEPRLFSFNSPIGACPCCNGLGVKKSFDPRRMVANEELSIAEGAISPISKKNGFLQRMVISILEQERVDINTPFNRVPKSIKNILFQGTSKVYRYSFQSENSHFEFSKSFPGIPAWLEKKHLETKSEKTRKDLEQYMDILVCPECDGKRLNAIALSTLVGRKNIIEISEMSIEKALHFFQKIKLTGEKKIIADKLLKEIISRLIFLNNVGLDYLSLNRSSGTLSGGESQRIRLATQIGSALSGVLYVLDEPSIGLHQRDNQKLLDTLKSLRDLGNTILVVEHDEETMLSSDYLIDMGPGAGIHGGQIVVAGPIETVLKCKKSKTAMYLNGLSKIDIPKKGAIFSNFIELKKAKCNNLKSVDVSIPLGGVVCVTGVSGSGKSTLIHEVLVPAIKSRIFKANSSLYTRENFHSLSGIDSIRQIIELDQSPIGRTPHSNPATYTGLFDEIRKLFSLTTESQIRGYKQGRFSFNVKGGRCEECEGNGVKKIEMHFLPDVYITCNDCDGSRYNRETLSVLYKSKSIADVLKMSIEESRNFFKNHRKIFRVLDTMCSVGLGYIQLGQSATTLSGGEAQRLKLSRELSKSTKGHCFYVLDEPTTGLHFEDVNTLLLALHRLVDLGHSVLIIEHNLDVIKTSDYIIDLGPEGGDKGGTIVAFGTPEEISKNKNSYTGKFLKIALSKI